MPVTLKTGVMKYRKSDGTYSVMDALMPEQTQGQIAAIETAGQEQVDAVEQKGQDILNSLPEDYTELETDVGELKSAIEDLEAGSLSAVGAANNQVPTAHGNGTWTWENQQGGGAVQDVQVDGVSVLDAQGVANVPIGEQGKLGVYQIYKSFGINTNSNGQLYTYCSGTTECKNGTDPYRPIAPGIQHFSTFYGLAKAAGDTTQSASSNAVGTYTDSAKSALQTMLGVSGIIAPVEDATASKAYAIGDAFLHGGALYKASAAIAAGDAIVPGTNCTQTTIIEMLKGA